MIQDNDLESLLVAVQEANNDKDNYHITHWLSKLTDDQLLWSIYIFKRLASLGEGVYMRRAFGKGVRNEL